MKKLPLQRKPLKNAPKGQITRNKRHKGIDAQLTDELWELTRQIVFKTYGTNCYTCPATHLSGKNLQGGHVPWASAELSMECRYDIRFIRPQCYDCNINKSGRGAVALERMQKEGIDIEFLKQLNLDTKGLVYGRQWKREKIEEYKPILQTCES